MPATVKYITDSNEEFSDTWLVFISKALITAGFMTVRKGSWPGAPNNGSLIKGIQAERISDDTR
jgi:hypothetical protein